MQTKQCDARVTVKNADLGEVEAVFATLGVKDHDGDIILPGAIKDGATVAISQYGHSVWKGNPPAGVGTIHEVGDELIVKGRYFLDTDHGRNDFGVVKGLAESGAGEWSFGLLNVSGRKGTHDGVSGNLIDSVDVPEVSPVFIGAGIDTRTTSVKAADVDTPEQFSEHLTAVLASVKALTTRTREVIAYRVEKGKSPMSDANADLLEAIASEVDAVKAAIDEQTDPAPDSTDEANMLAQGEYLRFVANTQGLHTS